jgi:hypothetical protein
VESVAGVAPRKLNVAVCSWLTVLILADLTLPFSLDVGVVATDDQRVGGPHLYTLLLGGA